MDNPKDTFFLIKLINDQIRTVFDADMKGRGLTASQCRVLAYLDSHNESASQKSIEEHLHVSHPTVVGLVSRLEKSGFVECHTDETNKRNKIVTSTQKAIDSREDVIEKRESFNNLVMNGFDEEELCLLNSMLSRIYRNITNTKILSAASQEENPSVDNASLS